MQEFRIAGVIPGHIKTAESQIIIFSLRVRLILYSTFSNTVIGTLAVVGWAAIFGTALPMPLLAVPM